MKMKKRLLATAFPVLASCCLCFFADTAGAQAGTIEYTRSVLEKLAQKELDRGVPSISLSLVKGDQIVWSAAWGYANVGLKAPATPETFYMTASTLKSVTSTAILTLVDQGMCKLDDPVNKYLGDKTIDDKPRDSVTIRSLLDHTSGLSDESGQSQKYIVNVWDRERPSVPPLEEIATSLETLQAVGETWRYNNSAYALAGLLIENISGMSYEQYIVERVLAPVGATTDHPITPTAKMAELMAFNYLRLDNGEFEPADHNYDGFYPAGGARLRAEDMARFLGAHLNRGRFNGNQILSRALIDEAHKANKEQYGLGWWTFEDDSGHTMITHGGNWPSAVTVMLGDKNAQVGAYVMTNVGQTQATYRIAEAAVRLLRGEEVSLEDRVGVDIEPAQLERLVGTYEQPNGIQINLIRENGQLKFVYPDPFPYNGITYTYLAASETVFFEPNMGIELEFQENDSGEIDGFQQRQHGWIDYGFSRRIRD